MSILLAASSWLSGGASVIPIKPGAAKQPLVRWTEYQQKRASDLQVHGWFSGNQYGLAVICGKISGNLEMTELEGRATDGASVQRIMDELQNVPLWQKFLAGYSEWSPSGGLHFLYRISDHEVPGNTKIARRPATAEELEANPADKIKVLAETRGEGGYVVVAPTDGRFHATGNDWRLYSGGYGVVPTVTWAERCELHDAIARALDVPIETAAPVLIPRQPRITSAGLTPGDDFGNQVDWSDDLLLGGAGWTLHSQRGQTRFWTRPGKNPRDGFSASTGHANDADRLYVFSTSTIFDSETPYTKFAAYAILHHGGDFSAAAKELSRLGYGERTQQPLTLASLGDSDNYTPTYTTTQPSLPVAEEKPVAKSYTLDETGNAERLWDQAGWRFRYLAETGKPWVFDGRVWREDYDGELVREMVKLTSNMATSARMMGEEGKELAKWARSSRSHAKIVGSCKLMGLIQPGATVKSTVFDQRSNLLNLQNGVLDLVSGKLSEHDSTLMQTRMFNASYNPEATCPNWDEFISRAMPDPKMRSYLQRSLGYSLLGDADQRSIFVIHGPTGTGKSTLLETIQAIFGDYGATSAASTFRSRRSDTSAPTNDLHGLRGKRFVSTSETSEYATFDEDLLKRLSGSDTMTSRDIYEKFQSWQPECVLWLATNHAPRFSADDQAMWRRVKMVPFLTQFSVEGGEVAGYARRFLVPEADGILNWLLAGLRDYLQFGLEEPECVREAAAQEREAADSVLQFVDSGVLDGSLELGATLTVQCRALYISYVEWCKIASQRPVGPNRFEKRLSESTRPIEFVRTPKGTTWVGVGRRL